MGAVLRTIAPHTLLVPLSVVIGSLGGAAAASLFLPGCGIREGMAVGAGFGYYSLSSIVISRISGDTLGAVALLSNILREILTLVLTPLLFRRFGSIAPIASAGATAMDTTLPVIVRYCGMRFGAVSLFSGVVLTFAVPFLIGFILS